jgi:hypothetical protein
LYNADQPGVSFFFGPTVSIDAVPLLRGTSVPPNPGGRIQNLVDVNALTSTPAVTAPLSPNGQGRWAVQLQVWGDNQDGSLTVQLNSGATDQTGLQVNAWS